MAGMAGLGGCSLLPRCWLHIVVFEPGLFFLFFICSLFIHYLFIIFEQLISMGPRRRRAGMPGCCLRFPG